MIDAHHHFWQYNEHEFVWITPEMSILRANFGPEQLHAECRAAGVHGVISVQARTTLAETDALLACAKEHDFVLGVVGWVDLCAPDIGAILDRYAENPRLLGMREICQGATDEQFFDNPAFNRGIAELHSRGLTYDLLILAEQLRSAARFVDRHPKQSFVVDHCAKPPIRRGEFPKEWADDLDALARRENVYCKLSGLATEVRSSGDWEPELFRPYFEAVLTAFGPRRVMFGSDWPVSLLSTSYQRWAAACKTMISSLSAAEQSAILSETARHFYRLSSGETTG